MVRQHRSKADPLEPERHRCARVEMFCNHSRDRGSTRTLRLTAWSEATCASERTLMAFKPSIGQSPTESTKTWGWIDPTALVSPINENAAPKAALSLEACCCGQAAGPSLPPTMRSRRGGGASHWSFGGSGSSAPITSSMYPHASATHEPAPLPVPRAILREAVAGRRPSRSTARAARTLGDLW